MPCPFPGMDSYIERPEIWADFHDSLITYIKAALQPLLRPRYAAVTQERLYVVELQRPIRPDVSLLPVSTKKNKDTGGAAVLELDAPFVFRLIREEIREPLIHIIEPATGNRLVTAIEVLSPSNKTLGDGRESYLVKREELWGSGANLVEVDLLRSGDRTVRVSAEELASLGRWHYLVAVTRYSPSQQELYNVPLGRRLPRFSIPLAENDEDVPLDLQAVFTRCWSESAYPELLGYDGPPPGPLTPEERAWCEEILRTNGFRQTKRP